MKMSMWGVDICQTCLSTDRTLYSMSKLQPILKELHFLQLINLIGGICWECRQIIMKIRKFKNQILQAQNVLYHNTEIKYLGSLSEYSKYSFDYQYQYDTDPLVHIDLALKNEITLKVEQKIPDADTNYLEYKQQDSIANSSDDVKLGDKDDYGQKMNNDQLKKDRYNRKQDVVGNNKRLYVLRNVKRKFKSVSKKFKKDIDEYRFRDKFTTIQFTEEEMIRNREEKRNQPNFKKIPYKCDSCVLGFTKKETYDLHMKKKHDESIGSYICQVCSTRFTSPKAMERHRQQHYMCYRCQFCKYETLQYGSAVGHCVTKHGSDESGKIHCDQCAYIAVTPEDLADHLKTKHTLFCNECGEKFKGKHTLRTHKSRIHTSNRSFICDICSRTFKTKSRLESHISTHNATLAQKLSFCGVCKVQYKNIHVYRNHLKNSTNHSERVYECQDCNKRFASKVYWQKHCDFYHHKKSRFKCDVCNKLFISDWRLKNHMQTHHGSSRTRNHTCNVCGKKFYTSSTLRAHQLTHSAQRSYMCEQCGDTFRQRAALHTHAARHRY